MEVISDDDLVKLCRLCMKQEGYKQPIFGFEGAHRGLSHKISVCFPFQVYETDPLPKLICHRCVYKLEQFHQFRTDVLNAFQSVKKLLLQRTDPEIHRYFSLSGEEPIAVSDIRTLRNAALQRTDAETYNCVVLHGEESLPRNDSRTFQSIGIQSSWPLDDEMVLDSECISPTEDTVGDDCEDFDGPKFVPFHGLPVQSIPNNGTMTISLEENAENDDEELNVITHTLFDENFTRELCRNESVIVSREESVDNVNCEVDVTTQTPFYESCAQDLHNNDCTAVSQEENIENDNDQDVKHIPFDVISMQEQQNDNSEPVAGTETLEQPGSARLNDDGGNCWDENIMDENNTDRSKNEYEASDSFSCQQLDSMSHQKQDATANSASPLRKPATYYWCNYCLKYLKSRKQFRNHNVKVHMVGKPPTHNCICRRKFHTLFDVLTHQKSHLSVQVDVADSDLLECYECHKKFYDSSIFSSHLFTHYEKHSQGNQRPSLKSCWQKSERKSVSRKELGIGETPVYFCQYCRLSFKTTAGLELHVKSEVCLSSCEINVPKDKKSPRKSSESPLKQSVQAKSSGANVALMNAAISYHGSTITKHFNNFFSVMGPKTSLHPNQQSPKKFQCSVCTKCFKSTFALKEHQKIHITPETTKISNSLHKKTSVHTDPVSYVGHALQGDKYQCQHCSKVFSERQILLNHKCLSDKGCTYYNKMLHPPRVGNIPNSSTTIKKHSIKLHNNVSYKTPQRKSVHTDKKMTHVEATISEIRNKHLEGEIQKKGEEL